MYADILTSRHIQNIFFVIVYSIKMESPTSSLFS